MGLGPDGAICTGRLVDAMKHRLSDASLDPNNVDLPAVKPNFEALGKAVWQILTLDAAATSDATADNAFWTWLAAIDATVRDLASWRTAVANAATAWAAPTADADIKAALAATIVHPTIAPATPTTLQSSIE